MAEENILHVDSSENTTENQFLFFGIAEEEYGVEIAHVKEIIKVCNITKVPHTETYIKGIINLRGDIIPVVNVRERFGIPAKPYDDRTCIIVLNFEDNTVGLIVDDVNEVMYIDTNKITPPPSDKYGYNNRFIKNIGNTEKNVKQIVDLNKLLLQQ